MFIRVTICDRWEFDRVFNGLFHKNVEDQSKIYIRKITYLPGNKLNKNYCGEIIIYRALVYSKIEKQYIAIDSDDSDLYKFIIYLGNRFYDIKSNKPVLKDPNVIMNITDL